MHPITKCELWGKKITYGTHNSKPRASYPIPYVSLSQFALSITQLSALIWHCFLEPPQNPSPLIALSIFHGGWPVTGLHGNIFNMGSTFLNRVASEKPLWAHRSFVLSIVSHTHFLWLQNLSCGTGSRTMGHTTMICLRPCFCPHIHKSCWFRNQAQWVILS